MGVNVMGVTVRAVLEDYRHWVLKTAVVRWQVKHVARGMKWLVHGDTIQEITQSQHIIER